MLFHQTLGVGPKGLDPELRVEFPTLARQAVKLQLDREMKAEELRLLYVAMTRAKDKLILTLCLANGERTLNGLREYAGPHPDPRALLQRDSVGGVAAAAGAGPGRRGGIVDRRAAGGADCAAGPLGYPALYAGFRRSVQWPGGSAACIGKKKERRRT